MFASGRILMPTTILKSGLLRCKVTLRSGKLTFTKKPGVIIQACLPGLLIAAHAVGKVKFLFVSQFI